MISGEGRSCIEEPRKTSLFRPVGSAWSYENGCGLLRLQEMCVRRFALYSLTQPEVRKADGTASCLSTPLVWINEKISQ